MIGSPFICLSILSQLVTQELAQPVERGVCEHVRRQHRKAEAKVEAKLFKLRIQNHVQGFHQTELLGSFRVFKYCRPSGVMEARTRRLVS